MRGPNFVPVVGGSCMIERLRPISMPRRQARVFKSAEEPRNIMVLMSM